MIVTVDLAERSYDVVIDHGARARVADVVARRAPNARRAAVVTTAAVRAQPWFDLDPGVDAVVVEAPDGEAAKTPERLAELVEALAAARLSRDDVVVAVGGGALTDVAGLAAALYRRGVGVVMVPTTLVGQADAAIGGKTAVNLSVGKNLMGAFHQPLGVLCDLDALATLSARDRAAGLAEVAKCWLLERRGARAAASAGLEERVAVAAALKAAIVSADELEAGGRALLNYGHTLAHALEAVAREAGADVRHGEAVAVGLAFAARLGALARARGRRGGVGPRRDPRRLRALGPAALAADAGELVAVMAPRQEVAPRPGVRPGRPGRLHARLRRRPRRRGPHARVVPGDVMMIGGSCCCQGPNLDELGHREPDVYGTATLDELVDAIHRSPRRASGSRSATSSPTSRASSSRRCTPRAGVRGGRRQRRGASRTPRGRCATRWTASTG